MGGGTCVLIILLGLFVYYRVIVRRRQKIVRRRPSWINNPVVDPTDSNLMVPNHARSMSIFQPSSALAASIAVPHAQETKADGADVVGGADADADAGAAHSSKQANSRAAARKQTAPVASRNPLLNYDGSNHSRLIEMSQFTAAQANILKRRVHFKPRSTGSFDSAHGAHRSDAEDEVGVTVDDDSTDLPNRVFEST